MNRYITLTYYGNNVGAGAHATQFVLPKVGCVIKNVCVYNSAGNTTVYCYQGTAGSLTDLCFGVQASVPFNNFQAEAFITSTDLRLVVTNSQQSSLKIVLTIEL